MALDAFAILRQYEEALRYWHGDELFKEIELLTDGKRIMLRRLGSAYVENTCSLRQAQKNIRHILNEANKTKAQGGQ